MTLSTKTIKQKLRTEIKLQDDSIVSSLCSSQKLKVDKKEKKYHPWFLPPVPTEPPVPTFNPQFP
jgi:hypothetical protein